MEHTRIRRVICARLLFELLVIRDLRVLSQPLDGEVLHHRDAYGVKLGRICGKGYGQRRADG